MVRLGECPAPARVTADWRSDEEIHDARRPRPGRPVRRARARAPAGVRSHHHLGARRRHRRERDDPHAGRPSVPGCAGRCRERGRAGRRVPVVGRPRRGGLALLS